MVGAVDRCPVATATYAENFASARRNVVTTTLSDDTGAEIFNNIGKIDLLIASPECTHHSLARGSRPRCEDSRRSGWFVTRFIEDLEPEFIVLENVAMMRHWDGYKDLLQSLERRHGYKLRAQVLDSADFGVPQNARAVLRRFSVATHRHSLLVMRQSLLATLFGNTVPHQQQSHFNRLKLSDPSAHVLDDAEASAERRRATHFVYVAIL